MRPAAMSIPPDHCYKISNVKKKNEYTRLNETINDFVPGAQSMPNRLATLFSPKFNKK